MYFCANDSSIWLVWVHKGVAPCFLETIYAGFLIIIFMLFGIIQSCTYRRFGTLRDIRLKPSSCLFSLQILAHLIMAVLPVVRFLLDRFWFGVELSGSDILTATVQPIAWLFSYVLLMLERHYDLPSPPSYGHGVLLLLFWFTGLLVKCVQVASFNGEHWFWQMAQSVILSHFCFLNCLWGSLKTVSLIETQQLFC